MRFLSYPSALVFIILSTAVTLFNFASKKTHPFHTSVGLDTSIQAGQSETAVIDIARQHKLNVIIDSTDVAPTAPLQEINLMERRAAYNVGEMLVSCAEEHHLSAESFNSNTFVFWAEPDQKLIAQSALQGEGFGLEQGVPSTDEILRDLRLELDAPAVQDELTAAKAATNRPYGVQGEAAAVQRVQTPSPVLSIKLSQLSPGLQHKLVPFFIQRTLDSASNSRDYSELWLRDEVWRRAYVWVRPADTVLHSEADLVVLAEVETPQHRLLIRLYPATGAMGAEIECQQRSGLPIVPTSGLEVGQLRVLPSSQGGEAGATILEDKLLPAGSGFKSLQAANPQGSDFTSEKLLQSMVSLNTMRRPLSELLREAGQPVGITLNIAHELESGSPLASAHVQQMPLAQLMQAVAHTYGAVWTKEDAQTFTLKTSGRSAFQLKLLQVGYGPWYRFRDVSLSAHKRKQQEFKDFAAKVFEETGGAIGRAPGVAFTSLSTALQTELHEKATVALARRVIDQQVRVRNLLSGEWSFRIAGGTLPQVGASTTMWAAPTLSLQVDGKTRGNLAWFPTSLTRP